jgi:crotonobetainyl-CoA:carnitine CoA-transferase CaiB-like acyl-CoA transferase
LAQAFADPQVLARNLIIIQPVAHTQHGNVAIDHDVSQAGIRTVASPLRLSATPPVVRRAPPALGQHTDEVLAELGLSPAQTDALHARGVV